MVQPQLPTEIVSMILKLLSDNTPHGWRDKVTLSRCCLVSTSLLPLARAELYRSLTFSIANPQLQAKVQALTERSLHQFLDHASYRLRETLIYRPELGGHVEEARVTAYSAGHPVADQIYAQILDEVRGRCHNLHAIRLDTSEEGHSSRALARFGSQLRSLRYKDGLIPTPSWFEVLNKLTGLEDIFGLSASRSNFTALDAPRPNCQLKSVHAFKGAQLKSDLLFLILRNSHASLKSLTIPSYSAEGKAWDLSPFVGLQRLELVLELAQGIEEGSGNDMGVGYTVGTCRALESLRFARHDEGPRLRTAADEVPFLRILPPTLRFLDIGTVQASSTYVQEALGDPDVLPSLRALTLGDSTQTGDSWYAGRGMSSWSSCHRREADKKAIEELCRVRSIQLEWEKWKQGRRR